MKINNISNANNSSFKGYVDKSVFKFCKKQQNVLYNRALHHIELTGNKNNVHTKNLAYYTSFISNTLKNLNEYTKKLHSATFIGIKESLENNSEETLFIANSKTKTNSTFGDKKGAVIAPFPQLANVNENDYFQTDIVEENILKLYEWSEEILKFEDNNDVDSELFDRMIWKMNSNAADISIKGRIKTFFNGLKANRLAPEFGQEPDYMEQFGETQKKAIKQKQHRKELNKEVDKFKKEFKFNKDYKIKP